MRRHVRFSARARASRLRGRGALPVAAIVAALALGAPAAASGPTPPAPKHGSGSVAAEQSLSTKLKAKITALSTVLHAKSAIENAATAKYLAAATSLGQIRGEVYATNHAIKKDRRRIAATQRELGQLAAASYVNSSSGAASNVVAQIGSNGEKLDYQAVYGGIVAGKMQHDVAAVEASQAEIQRQHAVLLNEEAVATQRFAVAKSAHDRAAAIAGSYQKNLNALNHQLSHVEAALRPTIIKAAVPPVVKSATPNVTSSQANAAVASGKIVFPFENPSIALPSGSWSLDDGVDIGTVNDVCGSAAVEVAIAPGVVVGEGIPGFGPAAPVIRISAGPLTGRFVYYGHALPALVSVGEHVTAGQPVADVGCGSVGYSTAPHLEIGVSPGYSDALPYYYETSPQMLKLLLNSV